METRKPEPREETQETRKTYYWCQHHNNDKGMWVLHKPEKYKNKPKEKFSSSNRRNNNDNRDDFNQEQVMPVIEEPDNESCKSSSSEELG